MPGGLVFFQSMPTDKLDWLEVVIGHAGFNRRQLFLFYWFVETERLVFSRLEMKCNLFISIQI